ncbi:MAG: hypothetical protein J6A01_12530 [Proteobacteria bacterium]|nr:hypothetical protein [Pseudomonadota bacterium]
MANAQEHYASVNITTPPHWTMREMQTFSGSVPSRAWIYAKGEEEVVVSAMVTEGIITGLEGQSTSTLAKIYTEALVVGWGGKSNGEPDGIKQASFCAGEAGYKLEATFGEQKFDYYGCFMLRRDFFRATTVVTWVPAGTPEEIASRRLMTFVQATDMGKPEE